MASPSHSEAKDKDWLDLGLGLGFNIACSKEAEGEDEGEGEEHRANSATQTQKKPNGLNGSAGLELGLSLGIDLESRPGMDDDDHEDEEAEAEDDYDDMAWWRCDMDDWQMPVPNNNHHDYFPRTRPHSGLWFTLQSYTNRNGDALPQIPKAYIRVKDENVTVFMVKKYLVRKLGLSNEAEVDISCMGQKLLQTLTLKQVRDCVWLPRLVQSLSPTAITFQNHSHQSCMNDHLMSLQYGRRCALN